MTGNVGGIGPGPQIQGVEGQMPSPQLAAAGEGAVVPGQMNKLEQTMEKAGQSEQFKTIEDMLQVAMMQSARALSRVFDQSNARIKQQRQEAESRQRG